MLLGSKGSDNVVVAAAVVVVAADDGGRVAGDDPEGDDHCDLEQYFFCLINQFMNDLPPILRYYVTYSIL